MSDDRLNKIFEELVPATGDPNSNAGNTNDARIISALERMIGITIMKDGRQVWSPGETILDSVIPDFRDSVNILEYNELSRSIAAFKAITNAASDFGMALHDVPEPEKAKLNGFFRRRLGRMDGLSIASVAALAGIVDMGDEATLRIEIAAMMEMRSLERLRDANFTKGRGRRKNARAYHVADTLAQFYLKALKERPTFGMSDGYPSTRFATALQEIFQILGIKAHIRGPAESAIKQITDEDLNRARPSLNALAAYRTCPTK